MKADVLVIGGGLHGLSAALHLARRGVSVIVAERHFVGRHASGATAAGVRTLGRNVAELPISLEASGDWLRMTELVGDDCGFIACGQFQAAEDETALAAIAARIERLRAQGYRHEHLVSAEEARSLIPNIAPHCLGGAWVATDGSADPHRAIRAFRDSALAAGVRILETCVVTVLDRVGQIWRAATSHGPIEAKITINAAGAWSDKVAALAGDPLHHQIRTSMMVVTERAAARIGPVVSSYGRKLSFKQTAQGTLLIGGGAQGRLNADRESATVDVVALAAAVGAAVRLFPCVQGVRIVRTWAGMEAMTADHLPVIGFSRTVEGLIHSFGFSGHGFQLVPAVGRVLADLVCDGVSRHDLGAFDARRVAGERVAA